MSDTHDPTLSDVDVIQRAFESAGYICTSRIATVVRLAAALEKPVLIEGPPGVGKTELAKTCATVVNRPLVRLQCYEGLDESKALYEWKYGKQLLYTQLLKEQLEQQTWPRDSLLSKQQKQKRVNYKTIKHNCSPKGTY